MSFMIRGLASCVAATIVMAMNDAKLSCFEFNVIFWLVFISLTINEIYEKVK